MKILLINPPRSPHNAILDHAPREIQRFVHRRLIGPPLGLITVAGALQDHEVHVLDLKGECDLPGVTCDPLRIVQSWVAKHDPAVVGITIIASEYPVSMQILAAVKKCNPQIITVAGGLHVTLCPQDFNRPEIDYAISGQAAHRFAALISAFSGMNAPETVPGILIRKDSALFLSAGTNPVFEQFVFPDRSHLKRWLSTYRVGRSPGPVTYLYTSLGCPYSCTFCSIWPQFKGAYCQRSIDSIIQELKTLTDYPVVRFADANTIVNIPFIRDLFRKIALEEIRKEFIMDIRVDTAAENPELIKQLAQGGLKVAIAGFESFRDDELSKFNKGSGAHLIRKAIDVFHDNGILVRGNYVIDPQYTERDFDALATFSDAHRVSFAGYTILTPMPGTAFYEEIRNSIIDHDLAKYNFFNCVVNTRLPLETFYEQVGSLWSIRKGDETI